MNYFRNWYGTFQFGLYEGRMKGRKLIDAGGAVFTVSWPDNMNQSEQGNFFFGEISRKVSSEVIYILDNYDKRFKVTIRCERRVELSIIFLLQVEQTPRQFKTSQKFSYKDESSKNTSLSVVSEASLLELTSLIEV